MSSPPRSRLLRRVSRAALGVTHGTVLLTWAGTSGAAGLTVTNTNASGSGSLAAAITAANSSVNIDQIVFSIDGADVHTIPGNLPSVTGPVSIQIRATPACAT